MQASFVDTPQSTASTRDGPCLCIAVRSAATSSSHVVARLAGTPMPCSGAAPLSRKLADSRS